MPLDGRVSLHGARLLGDSITVGGLLIAGVITALTYAASSNLTLAAIPLLVYAGGALGSFIKRRLKLAEGKHLILIDHGDYMILTGMTLVLLGRVTLALAASALVVTYILHPIATFVAYKAHLRTDPL
jgi:NAD/NADP transhydrogenase beta subunit